MGMRYKCGMYGGSFNPLHIGHVRCMIQAANMCEKLIIVISSG
ncbi:MAG: adenylyltransferase/cytidyltransferase family protein, partial [Oscillospiraceae bacterium]